jgi:hypothetical protein
LRTQAEKAGKKRKIENVVHEEQISEDGAENDNEGDVEGPKLLPQSLLDALDRDREPTPDAEPPRPTTKKVRKIHSYNNVVKLPLASKPKDLTLSSAVSVSVLEKPNELLAPQVVQKSKGVRANLLRGRTTMAANGTQKGRTGKGKGKVKHVDSRMQRRPWGSAARTFA